MRAFLSVLALLLVAASSAPPRYLVAWAMEAQEHPAHGEGRDVLTVFDISDGLNFGKLVAYVPTPIRGMMAHHTNTTMPANHRLFANDFMAAESQIIDVTDVRHPLLAEAFTDAAGYTHPHSFATLSNGNVLATYQIKGNADEPGALVELDDRGNVVKATSAAAPDIDENIRPYSVLAIESLDRVVTTSAPMPPLNTKAPTSVVQIWRLSDLTLLKTIPLSKAPFTTSGATYSDDALLLDDGKTVLVKTATCGLFALTGIDGESPNANYVYDFGGRLCSGVPVLAGHYWVEAQMSAHSLIALDVRDPMHPVEVSRLYLGPTAKPHWLAIEPGTGNIVINGYGSLLHRISFASIDLRTGAMTLDSRSIDLNRAWPDGWNGPLIAHGTVFYR
ncbi:MAG: hypothetical protein WBD74_16355 [Candidatus Aquilonibacter sp.]